MYGRKMKTRQRIHLKHRRGRWYRGEMIIEAAFLVPWAVLLTAFLIILIFFIHNRNWYLAAAYETALVGNQYIPGSGGSGRAGYADGAGEANTAGQGRAEKTAQSRIREQAMPGSAPDWSVSCENERTQVTFSGQTYPLFDKYFSWEVSGKVKKIRPAPQLGTLWVARRVVQDWTQGGDIRP